MRILILTSHYPPLVFSGHSERCRQTTSLLARRGHTVQVLTSNHRLQSQGVRGERGVRRRLLLNRSEKEPFGRMRAREKTNIDTLHDSLARFRPDCVFVWDMRGLQKSLLFFLQNRGVPLVYDLHSNWLAEDFEQDPWIRWWRGPASLSRALQRCLLRFTLRARSLLRHSPVGSARELDLTHAYACSIGLKDALEAYGLSVADLEVITPATDDQILPVKFGYHDTNRFMWAGRLSPEKDPYTVVEAISILRRRGLPATLHLFVQGEQVDRKRLRVHIDETGAAEYITIRHIRPSKLLSEFGLFDAFISSSGKEDPCPMTPIEAILAGIPCIATRAGAVCEMVREEEHCLSFEFGNPNSLADTLEKYCEKPDNGRDMALKCREWLQQKCVLSTAIVEIERHLAAAADALNPDEKNDVDDGNANPARGSVRS